MNCRGKYVVDDKICMGCSDCDYVARAKVRRSMISVPIGEGLVGRLVRAHISTNKEPTTVVALRIKLRLGPTWGQDVARVLISEGWTKDKKNDLWSPEPPPPAIQENWEFLLKEKM